RLGTGTVLRKVHAIRNDVSLLLTQGRPFQESLLRQQTHGNERVHRLKALPQSGDPRRSPCFDAMHNQDERRTVTAGRKRRQWEQVNMRADDAIKTIPLRQEPAKAIYVRAFSTR